MTKSGKRHDPFTYYPSRSLRLRRPPDLTQKEKNEKSNIGQENNRQYFRTDASNGCRSEGHLGLYLKWIYVERQSKPKNKQKRPTSTWKKTGYSPATLSLQLRLKMDAMYFTSNPPRMGARANNKERRNQKKCVKIHTQLEKQDSLSFMTLLLHLQAGKHDLSKVMSRAPASPPPLEESAL